VTHFIGYREYNSDDNLNKPIVYCAHGLTRNSTDFDFLAKKISQTGKYRVISFDFVGRGRSQWLSPESKETYGYPLYLQDALQLLKHLGRETFDYWIGTSMGGILAMSICAVNPKLIKHLVLNDIGALIGFEGLSRLAIYVGKDPKFHSFEEATAYLKEIFAPFGPLTEEMWVSVASTAFRQNKENDQWEFSYDPRISSALSSVTEDLNLEAIWKTVECPLLVIRGKESDLFPMRAVTLMKTYRDFDFVEFSHCGHAPSLMFDDQAEYIVNWLNKFEF
jgi:pimeloyl-ACP methyl ester carboxylesterase